MHPGAPSEPPSIQTPGPPRSALARQSPPGSSGEGHSEGMTCLGSCNWQRRGDPGNSYAASKGLLFLPRARVHGGPANSHACPASRTRMPGRQQTITPWRGEHARGGQTGPVCDPRTAGVILACTKKTKGFFTKKKPSSLRLICAKSNHTDRVNKG